MITHKRLKELIKQGAKIWCICDYTYHKSKPNKKIEYYDLSSEDVCMSPAELRNYGLRIYNSLGYWNDVRYENLFETKEEAEWYKEFGCIERTERLELPTWEEFNKQPEFYFDAYTLIKINDKILLKDSFKDYVYKEFTKENYTVACRKAKELFLGDNNGKI